MKEKITESFGDKILYQMCRDYHEHTDNEIVAGKIWLIGRSYAAAIERGAGSQIEKGEDFYRVKVAPKICDSPIDEWIKSVKNIKCLTRENITDSLRCHKKVMDLFAEIAGGTTKRSLASKYLHFHAPDAFFIYDSRARDEVKRRLGGRQKRPESLLTDCDLDYQIFCDQCLRYRDQMENKMGHQATVTPRHLDSELLNFQL